MAEQRQSVTQFYVANGVINEIGHVFLAAGVTLGAAARDSTEVVAPHLRPISEAPDMATSGQIKGGPSAPAIMLCAGLLVGRAD